MNKCALFGLGLAAYTILVCVAYSCITKAVTHADHIWLLWGFALFCVLGAYSLVAVGILFDSKLFDKIAKRRGIG